MKPPCQHTCHAGGEISATGHLSDGLSLETVHLLGLAVGRLVSMAQLAYHLGPALDVL